MYPKQFQELVQISKFSKTQQIVVAITNLEGQTFRQIPNKTITVEELLSVTENIITNY